MFPLPQHATNIVTLVDVGLVPVRARRSAEDLVRVNVPVLHPLHPVDAPVVFSEGLVDVASFVVVVVHVRIEFTQPVASGPCKEPFDHVPAHVVEVVAVVIEDGPPVVRMHDLTARLGAAVLVEQRAKGGRTRNGDDGLQVFTALSGRLPRGGALVGLAVNGNVAVAPILGAQPLHRFVDALPFPITTVIETTRAFLGGEHRHLSEGVAVRNEIVVDEFAAPSADHVGGAGLAAGRAVVEIRADHGDDRHLLAVFGVGRKPVREVDLSGVGSAFPCSGRVHLDERLLNRQGLVRPILEHAGVGAGPVPLQCVALVDIGVHPDLVGAGRWFGLPETTGQRHRQQQDGEHQRLSHEPPDERVHHQHDVSPQPLRTGGAQTCPWNHQQRGVFDGHQQPHPWPSATWTSPPTNNPSCVWRPIATPWRGCLT